MVVGGADESRVESGAAQVGDLCLLEDGSEYGDALFSDAVAFETASERQGDDGKSSVCQRALTQIRTLGGAAYLREVTALPLRPSHSLVMPSAV